jgi:phosphoribosyl-AMP cyclohydrolase
MLLAFLGWEAMSAAAERIFERGKKLLKEMVAFDTVSHRSNLGLIETGEAHYWSRSRQTLWHKGATSGLVQKVVQFRIDDDQDCVWLRVDVSGGASCHVGYRSCFYRSRPVGDSKQHALVFEETEKVFDPKAVYGDAPNPTKL